MRASRDSPSSARTCGWGGVVGARRFRGCRNCGCRVNEGDGVCLLSEQERGRGKGVDWGLRASVLWVSRQ